MGGPLVLIPAGALTVPATATLTGLAVGGLVASGVGLTWLLSSETATSGHTMLYKEFMKARMKELVDEGLTPSEAMKAVGQEWQARKESASTAASSSTPVKESKLKGAPGTFNHLRLEVPYLVEAQPDLSAAWDVAEGVLDFLMENAAGVSASEAFRRRAAAAYVRAKGGTSQGDQHEYELGRNLGEALLLVMAHRGVNQDQWIEMLPPQLVESALMQEEQGFVDKGLEMLGLKDEESTTSKAVKKVIDQAAQAGGQTVLDMLQ